MIYSFNSVNFAKLQDESREELRQRAQYRSEFYEQHNFVIQQILRTDMLKYMDGADISRMRLITVDWFVYQFMNRLNLVYSQPPVFKFEKSVKDQAKDRFNDLMSEVEIYPTLQDTFNRMRLHNTVLAHVKYHKRLDKVYVENVFDPGTSKAFGYPDYGFEPMIVAYKIIRNNKIIWVVWDRETGENYYCSEEPEFKGDEFVIGDKELIGVVDYWPWVVYRYRKQNDFWGNGMDALIELARAINILLSVTDDDTIQETLRLLILNFRPSGQQGELGQFKVGMRHPITPQDSGFDGFTPDGKIIQAELYNDQVVSWIHNLTDMVSSMHAIPNVIKSNLEQDLSGVALKLKNEPVLREWGKDIEKVRQPDRELLTKIIEVNNTYRPKNQIDPGILDHMDIDYREPQISTDESAEYNLAKQQWPDGTASPVEWVCHKNPEMTEEDALEYIKRNKDLYDELYAVDLEIEPDGVGDSE